jgi:hypothetical protein
MSGAFMEGPDDTKIDLDTWFDNFHKLCTVELTRRNDKESKVPKIKRDLTRDFNKLANDNSEFGSSNKISKKFKKRSLSRQSKEKHLRTLSREGEPKSVKNKKKLKLNLETVFGANLQNLQENVAKSNNKNRAVKNMYKSFFGKYPENKPPISNMINAQRFTKPNIKTDTSLNQKEKARPRSMSTADRNPIFTAKNTNDHQRLKNHFMYEKIKERYTANTNNNTNNTTNMSINQNQTRNTHKSNERKSLGKHESQAQKLAAHIEKKYGKREANASKEKSEVKTNGHLGSGSTRIPTSSRVDSNKRSTQNIQSFLETETKSKTLQRSYTKKLNIKDKNESFLAFKKKPNNTQRIFKSSISGINDIKKLTAQISHTSHHRHQNSLTASGLIPNPNNTSTILTSNFITNNNINTSHIIPNEKNYSSCNVYHKNHSQSDLYHNIVNNPYNIHQQKK